MCGRGDRCSGQRPGQELRAETRKHKSSLTSSINGVEACAGSVSDPSRPHTVPSGSPIPQSCYPLGSGPHLPEPGLFITKPEIVTGRRGPGCCQPGCLLADPLSLCPQGLLPGELCWGPIPSKASPKGPRSWKPLGSGRASSLMNLSTALQCPAGGRRVDFSGPVPWIESGILFPGGPQGRQLQPLPCAGATESVPASWSWPLASLHTG